MVLFNNKLNLVLSTHLKDLVKRTLYTLIMVNLKSTERSIQLLLDPTIILFSWPELIAVPIILNLTLLLPHSLKTLKEVEASKLTILELETIKASWRLPFSVTCRKIAKKKKTIVTAHKSPQRLKKEDTVILSPIKSTLTIKLIEALKIMKVRWKNTLNSYLMKEKLNVPVNWLEAQSKDQLVVTRLSNLKCFFFKEEKSYKKPWMLQSVLSRKPQKEK